MRSREKVSLRFWEGPLPAFYYSINIDYEEKDVIINLDRQIAKNNSRFYLYYWYFAILFSCLPKINYKVKSINFNEK